MKTKAIRAQISQICLKLMYTWSGKREPVKCWKSCHYGRSLYPSTRLAHVVTTDRGARIEADTLLDLLDVLEKHLSIRAMRQSVDI